MDNLPLEQDYIPGLGEEEQPVEFNLDELLGEEAEPDVIEMPDGSAVVSMAEDGRPTGGKFYDNLAEIVDELTLNDLALKFIYNIDADREARKMRDEQYEEGLRRTGMGDDAPGGAEFDGAARVCHPVMAEACVDFAARAMKELFPAGGPVKTDIVGEVTEEKIDIAERKRDYMNWQLTEQITEFRDELEQLLTQLPLGGSQFLKMWWCSRKRRPRTQFVPIDKILLPFSASSFYISPRVTEIQDITEEEYIGRVNDGIYRSTRHTLSSMELDATLSETANRKIEGKEFSFNDEDGIRRVFHISCNLEIEEDEMSSGKMAPYTLMIDDQDYAVVGLYRNWEDGDEDMEKLDWMVEFKFISWRGAYAIGFPQLIGGLAASATGALRALLDSAHINNAASVLKLKGAKVSGQTKNVQITQVTEIEGSGIDDIRKLAMPMPFNPPSPVLFELLGWLTGAAKGVVTTAEEKIADVTSNAPVGTTQALIEQGSVVFSSIHSKLHNSQRMVMKILQRINRYYLDDQKKYGMADELNVTADDFKRNTDVIPVSDPHIFSEGQRVAQNQIVLQMMEKQPDLYDARAVHSRVLKQMKIPNIPEIMPQFNKHAEMHAADENAAMSMARAVAVYPGQDHIAHLESHIAFALNPMLGMNPIIAPAFIPAVLEHIKQHMLLWYTQRVEIYAKDDLGELKPKYSRKDDMAQIDHAVASASHMVTSDIEAGFQKFMPVLQQLMQVAQQYAPKPPADPASDAFLKAGLAETERKTKKDAAGIQLDMKKLDVSVQQADEKNQIDMAMATEENLTEERIKTIQLSVDAAKLKGEQEQTVIDLQNKIQNNLTGERNGQE